MFSKKMLVMPFLLLMAACSSGVTRDSNLDLTQAQFATADRKAGQVAISLTADAQKELVDNLKFDEEKLLYTVRRALEVKGVLTKDSDPALPSIEISVTDIRVRSNVAAVLLGFMAGDDRIKGDVIVYSPEHRELQRFGVSASYALGGLAGGQDEARMGWLYESFAKRVVEELTGATATTADAK